MHFLWQSIDKLCGFCWECTYPSSESCLQMFFICPLLQHLLCCPEMLYSSKSWEKNAPHQKSCERFYLQNQPWSTFTARRQRQQEEPIRSVQSRSPQKTSFHPNIFCTHLLHIIRSFAYLLHSPSVVFCRFNNPSLLDFSLQHSCSVSP